VTQRTRLTHRTKTKKPPRFPRAAFTKSVNNRPILREILRPQASDDRRHEIATLRPGIAASMAERGPGSG
jgi:hypothetical protein